MLKIYQFFDIEKIVIQKISSEDFLVTNYCDLKLIIKEDLHFLNINSKEM